MFKADGGNAPSAVTRFAVTRIGIFLDMNQTALRMSPSLFAVGCFALFTWIAGCNSNSAMSLVTGKVTMDGKPYANAQVRFVPETGRPSIGLTNEEGVYRLVYIRDTLGAAPGSYKVDITTVHQSTSDADGGKEPPEKIPPKYNTRTELTKTVEPGENVIDFELQSK
ncbi:hypothetical protein [Pirellula sp. SH-Sr6A]|uniref:hypothetical protein n=1 Tax=Pirellula sp. SH-Sr6A TaxID=1632865 RepID=UPI00143A4CF7|nr:hypothetical protein [Pirellula sp. SH-Sr6A]